MDNEQSPDTPGPAVPAGRYGPDNARQNKRFRPTTRRILIAVPLVIVVGLVGFLAATNLTDETIEAERTSFHAVSEHAMKVNLRVSRDQPDRAAVCVVRTRSLDGVESGRREVVVPAGESRLSTVVTGNAEPVTVSVVGCGYDVPSYMSEALRPKE